MQGLLERLREDPLRALSKGGRFLLANPLTGPSLGIMLMMGASKSVGRLVGRVEGRRLARLYAAVPAVAGLEAEPEWRIAWLGLQRTLTVDPACSRDPGVQGWLRELLDTITRLVLLRQTLVRVAGRRGHGRFTVPQQLVELGAMAHSYLFLVLCGLQLGVLRSCALDLGADDQEIFDVMKLLQVQARRNTSSALSGTPTLTSELFVRFVDQAGRVRELANRELALITKARARTLSLHELPVAGLDEYLAANPDVHRVCVALEHISGRFDQVRELVAEDDN